METSDKKFDKTFLNFFIPLIYTIVNLINIRCMKIIFNIYSTDRGLKLKHGLFVFSIYSTDRCLKNRKFCFHFLNIYTTLNLLLLKDLLEP